MSLTFAALEMMFARDLATFMLKITSLRNCKAWTWQTMVDFQNLFFLKSILNVNGATSWNYTFDNEDRIFDFLHHNIGPHISVEGRLAYKAAGLCTDVTDDSLCPAYFRSQYMDVLEVLQNASSKVSLKKKVPSKLRCSCNPGNCVKCSCVTANRICNRWCHNKGDAEDSIYCQNCDISKVLSSIESVENRGIWND